MFIEINEKPARKQDGRAAIFKKSIAINIRNNSAQKRNFLSKKLWITNCKPLNQKVKVLETKMFGHSYIWRKRTKVPVQITLYLCLFCFIKKLLKNVIWCKFWSNCLFFLISTLNIYILYLCLVKKPVNVPATYLANSFCNSSNKNNTHTLESFIYFKL